MTLTEVLDDMKEAASERLEGPGPARVEQWLEVLLPAMNGAERYRWLRAQHDQGSPTVWVHFLSNEIPWHHPNAETLDSWIDKEMAGSAPQGDADK